MDSAGGEPAVRVPLRVLRQLQLPYGAYHQLITTLRRELRAADRDDPLLAELAESSAAALREALDRRALEEALAAHDHLLRHVIELAAKRPEVAPVLWQRYGDLLGQLTIQVHERLIPKDGGTPDFGAAERAGDGALCLRIAGILEPTLAQPWEVPHWLPVMEQQLVQHGALAWQHRIGADPAAAGPCLDLFLRLAQLLDPLPEWVGMGCRSAMTTLIERLPAAGAMTEGDLGLLIERVSRLPVAPERRQPFEAAVLRARFSLELQQQARGASGGSAAQGLEVMEAEWLQDDMEEAPAPVPLQLVAMPADEAFGPEIFSLAPFLGGDGEGAAAALEAFLQEWRDSERPASPPMETLPEGLAAGERLTAEEGTTSVLRQVIRSWYEALGPRITPLPAVDWRAGGLLVELDPLELVVLHHAAGPRDALENAMAELRRRHHDADFWGAPADDPFPALPDTLGALRAFALQAGFYATTHDPLESLRQWARPALQVLLRAQVWSADAVSQGLWLPWELQQIGHGGGGAGVLRQPPTGDGLLASLAGHEVLLVGDGTEALQRAHQEGQLFPGGAFGLRCLDVPESRHPARPAAGFEHSLEALVVAVEQLYRERPFTVLVTHAGAYRLPLLQAIASRFGVLAVAIPRERWLEEGPRSLLTSEGGDSLCPPFHPRFPPMSEHGWTNDDWEALIAAHPLESHDQAAWLRYGVALSQTIEPSCPECQKQQQQAGLAFCPCPGAGSLQEAVAESQRESTLLLWPVPWRWPGPLPRGLAAAECVPRGWTGVDGCPNDSLISQRQAMTGSHQGLRVPDQRMEHQAVKPLWGSPDSSSEPPHPGRQGRGSIARPRASHAPGRPCPLRRQAAGP